MLANPEGDESSATYLARQRERESNARTYPRALPLAIGRALGSEVFSTDGRRYLDFFAGAGVLALGHNHPKVVEAVTKQLGEVVHALDWPTPTRDRFVTSLLELLPPRLRSEMCVHICAPTGSDAIEAAIKLCKRATGRSALVAFRGAYHGMTAGALAVTSLRDVKRHLAGLMPDVEFAPYAYCARCALKLDPASCGTACAAWLETQLEDCHAGTPLPAAVVMEMVQGEGGSIVPRREFVERVRRATQRARVPLIADEIQAGLGRTGRYWAFEHFDVEPDVIAVSKALGGIGLPIAAILYRKELDVWEPGTHIGTFRGHQLAMAAGVAAIEVMRSEDLLHNARERGRQLLEGLRAARAQCVSEVRGLGLMLGVEFSRPDSGLPYSEAARHVRDRCFARGLLCELGGRADATLRLLPPLNLSEPHTREALDILVPAIESADRL